MNKKDPYNFDGNKLLWHMDRVMDHYDRGMKIPPIHIDAGLTKFCESKCTYCYGIFQGMTGEQIPPDQVIDFMRTAPLLGVRSLTLTGDGENIHNEGIWHGMVAGKENGLDIGLATNGIALDEHKLKIILSSCTWCRFNLSAVDQAAYKTIHGIDAWNKVQDNIKLAVRLKDENNYKCTIGLQMVLIPECADQILPEAYFAVRQGLDYFVIKQFSDPGDDRMSRFGLNWYRDRSVMETLQRAEELSNDLTRIIPKWDRLDSLGKRPYDGCVDCPLLFQVSGSGKCYPCGFLFGDERYEYGDLSTQTLESILDSDKYWGVIDYMRYKFDVHKDCKGCCRHDSTNEFIYDYLNPPKHLNFI